MICDLDPVSKPRQTRADIWKKRPPVLKYRKFADELRVICKRENFELSDQVILEFYIPMPKSWSEKKRKKMAGLPHQLARKFDIDNLQKSIFDILRPDDDGNIWDCHARKFWSREGWIKIENRWK